ncbi:MULTISPECIES: hypothetical protein [unclassified Chelatococcus]|uniref:hypothetical protein n=1 Tax=unclassified Chelatococcus TaxID=2638111 RepID=UPI001BCBA1D2|nr:MULTISPECIES: hypothetical protein [unclassified Chelatococcus]MBS7700097.1 hypothetical protein [Chelatococcus sp. YT9]MBX3556790.1 hypothetical protein [Chelatococcus sp.]
MNALAEKMLLGALAGFAATLPMTSAMSRMHRRLPPQERYPLPPRELSENLPNFGMRISTTTLLHHFLYGAASGALFAVVSRRRNAAAGGIYGAAVWTASYLGWIPASGILRIATRHPSRRNRLMLAAHLVWGASLAIGLRELERAELASFSRTTAPNGHLEDRKDEAQRAPSIG